MHNAAQTRAMIMLTVRLMTEIAAVSTLQENSYTVATNSRSSWAS